MKHEPEYLSHGKYARREWNALPYDQAVRSEKPPQIGRTEPWIQLRHGRGLLLLANGCRDVGSDLLHQLIENTDKVVAS
jgi:hypothetical protein